MAVSATDGEEGRILGWTGIRVTKLAVVSTLIGAAAFGSSARPAAATAAPGASSVWTIGPAKTVNLAHPPQAPPHHAAVLPVLPRDRVADQRAKAEADAGGVRGRQGQGVRTISTSTSLAPATSSTAASSIGILANLHGDDLRTQYAAYGPDNAVTPPDTTLATGNGFVVEPLNDSISVYNAAGQLVAGENLYNFWSLVLPSGHSISDPQAVFDSVTADHRFYLTMLGFDRSTNDSEILVAASQTSDPTGSWNLYSFQKTLGELHDQPILGMSDDKLTVSVNDYDALSQFIDSTTYVLNKADADAGTTLHVASFGPDTYWRPAPARSTSSTTTQFVVAYDSPTSSNLEVMAITGVPSATTMPLRTTSTLSIASTTIPPSALQPGQTPSIDTNGPRLLEAVWQNDTLWTGSNDGCTPTGDTAMRSCLRLLQVAAPTSATPSMTQDFDIAASGGYLYYPGFAMDKNANLYVPFSFSNPSTVYPRGEVLALDGGSPTAGATATLVGGSAYDGLDSASPPVRWGDYSGAAIDPSNPSEVWVATEFGGGDTVLGGGTNWATQLSQITLATTPPPSVVGVEGGNSALYVRKAGASGFTFLGGVLTGAPAVAAVPQSNASPVPLYVVTGGDHNLYVRSDTRSFQRLTTSGVCVDNPAAVVTGTAGNATLTVACQGGNHALYTIQGPVSAGSLPTLSGWRGLGGVLTAGPAVAKVGGTLTFFVTGQQGKVYTRTLSSAAYSPTPWTCLSHPAAATAGSTTTFACHGGDNALWYATNSGSGWSQLQSAGGTVVDGPGVAATSGGPVFFIEGSDAGLRQNFIPNGGSPTGWFVEGGVLRQGAGAVGLG